MHVITKRPTESYSTAIDFAGLLPTGSTIVSGTLAAVNRTTGATDNSVLASTTATVTTTTAAFKGQAGTSPADYLITLTVTLSTGDVLVEEVLLQVRVTMTLVATPGAATANSYCIRQEGDAYHQVHLYNTPWTQADDWKKEAALIMATRILDEQVAWNGQLASTTQALRWPRSGVLDRDGLTYCESATIPTFLKHATAELARHLLIEDRTKDRGFGIASVTADTVEVVFDKLDQKPVLPASVAAILAPYGQITTPGRGVVKVVRV